VNEGTDRGSLNRLAFSATLHKYHAGAAGILKWMPTPEEGMTAEVAG
jgi:hypothetical protein